MNREEIERSFVGAGWEVCESSSPYLLVGNAGDLAILAYRSLAETEDPVFELVDRKRGTAYWVEWCLRLGWPRCCWSNTASSRKGRWSATDRFEP